MMFKDREEAGYLLGLKLIEFKNNPQVIVLAIPRGGLPVGSAIANILNVSLEIVLSKKIGHPMNKEYAIGAVTLENCILSDDILEVSKAYIDEETKKIRTLLRERAIKYYGIKVPLKVKNKIVIIVDDGAATGNTLISSIKLIQLQYPFQIIIALPVASKSAFMKMNNLSIVDKIVCLLTPENFQSVGQFYENFSQVSDDKAIKLLNEATNKFNSN